MNRHTNFMLGNIGLVLRRTRALEGMTAFDLARKLQWSESRLRLIESDAIQVSTDEIDLLGQALEQEPNRLLFRCIKHLYPYFRVRSEPL